MGAANPIRLIFLLIWASACFLDVQAASLARSRRWALLGQAQGALKGLGGKGKGGVNVGLGAPRPPGENDKSLFGDSRGLLGGLDLRELLKEFLPREPPDPEARPYEAPFCYDNSQPCGQNHWKEVCKTGKRQSPINIVKSNTYFQPTAQFPLAFSPQYSKNHSIFYVGNNGHSVVVQVAPKGRSEAELSVVDLNLNFRFSHIHFHWKVGDVEHGSENLIDGKGYAMEIHLVHYRSTFINVEEALKSKTNNLAAVVALFVKIGEHNPHLDDAIKAIEEHALADTQGYKRVNGTLVVKNLLPPKLDKLFRFQGSLTVPKCVEGILWLVFEEPIEISQEQMEVFNKVECHNCPDHKMHNVRHVQPCHDRVVEYFDSTGSDPRIATTTTEEPIYHD